MPQQEKTAAADGECTSIARARPRLSVARQPVRKQFHTYDMYARKAGAGNKPQRQPSPKIIREQRDHDGSGGTNEGRDHIYDSPAHPARSACQKW